MEKIFPPIKRVFVPKNISFDWDSLAQLFQSLEQRELSNLEALKSWLQDKSEFEAVLSEEFAWRYIRMNIDTTNKEYAALFQDFVQNIQPNIAPFEDKLNKKFIACPLISELNQEDFKIVIRSTKNQLELYREKNIPLFTKLEEKGQEFGAISSQLSIEYKGKEYTLQQAAKLLKSTDREERKIVYQKIAETRNSAKVELNEVFNQLVEWRQEVAKNADFNNYRDYKFKAMGRFDYSPENCFEFHQAIKENVVPIQNWLDQKRKNSLNLQTLKPWDLAVDIEGLAPLKPFETGEELLEKTIQCFNQIDPFFGDCLVAMKNDKLLDLEAKKGKAPGGFNYPLYESGLPFIYMNAVGSMRDVTTLIHEGGHAVHSVLSHQLDLVDFKHLTAEIAELASMSMELISMDQWEIFFPDPADLKRAKREQLMDVLSTLPWVACIDKFQHWIYTHPKHTVEEREVEWEKIHREFSSEIIDWSDFPEQRKNLWQKQLHLFEVPFYYIEYGMAQLGAIAIWKNYRENPSKTIQDYKNALALGYTKTIGEVYETAGISFDFSSKNVKELSDFVFSELQKTF